MEAAADGAGGGRSIVTSDLFAVIPPSAPDFKFELYYSHPKVGFLHYGISEVTSNSDGKPKVSAKLISTFVNPDVNAQQELMYTDSKRNLAVIVEIGRNGYQLSSYRYGSEKIWISAYAKQLKVGYWITAC